MAGRREAVELKVRPRLSDTGTMDTSHEPSTDALFTASGDVLRLSAPMAQAVRGAVAAGTSVRIEVPEHLRSDFANGSLKFLEKATGEDTAILVRTEGSKIAGHANVVSDGVSFVSPAVAWKLMAVATQQQYLHAINEQLTAIAGGIAGLIVRSQHAQVGRLRAIERALAERRVALEAGVEQDSQAMAEARSWILEVDAIRLSALMDVRAATDDVSAARTRRALIEAVETLGGVPARDFEVAMAATHLLLAIRAHVLEIATGGGELDHLIERGTLEHRAAVAELRAAAQPFREVLDRVATRIETSELGDKLLGAARVPGDAAAKPFKRFGRVAAPAGVGAGAAAGGAAGAAAAGAAGAAGAGAGFAGLGVFGAGSGVMGSLAAAGAAATAAAVAAPVAATLVASRFVGARQDSGARRRHAALEAFESQATHVLACARLSPDVAPVHELLLTATSEAVLVDVSRGEGDNAG